MRLPASALAAAAVAAGLLVVALWFQSWGAVALLVAAASGWGWYRRQVARSAAAEPFFGDAGEDTRLTGFQGPGPGETPGERPPAPPPAR